MSDDAADDLARLRQRLKLMVRAERALGVTGIVLPSAPAAAAAAPAELVQPDQGELRHASVAHASSDERDVATEAQSSTVNLFGAADAGPAPVIAPIGPNRPAFDSPVHPRERRIELLAALDANEVKGCPKCDLCKTRTNTVFGEGDAAAQLMFIGEGPGENEDLQGRPFIGKAGELLTKMIAGMGLAREQVYIANIVKCRPPNNRVPAPDEVAACTPYLERQIEVIRPRVIVTLGLPSSQYMLQSKLSMSKLRGRWHEWRGIKLMPTYHPAYVLRSYTEQTRAAVWSDLKMVMDELGLKPRAKTSPKT